MAADHSVLWSTPSRPVAFTFWDRFDGCPDQSLLESQRSDALLMGDEQPAPRADSSRFPRRELDGCGVRVGQIPTIYPYRGSGEILSLSRFGGDRRYLHRFAMKTAKVVSRGMRRSAIKAAWGAGGNSSANNFFGRGERWRANLLESRFSVLKKRDEKGRSILRSPRDKKRKNWENAKSK